MLAQALPTDLRSDAERLATCEFVPWQVLHRACKALREAGQPAPLLQELARSGGLHLPPPARATRSEELEARMGKLRLRAAEREYQALVQDVTRSEREERERVPVSSALREVGYGVHVLTVMAACFVASLIAGRRAFTEPAAQVLFAAAGMLVALLVETGLFIIRDGRQPHQGNRDGAGS